MELVEFKQQMLKLPDCSALFKQAGVALEESDPDGSLKTIAANYGISQELAAYHIGFGYQWGIATIVRSNHYPSHGFEHALIGRSYQRVLRVGLPSEFALFRDLQVLDEVRGNSDYEYTAVDINALPLDRSRIFARQIGRQVDLKQGDFNTQQVTVPGSMDLVLAEFLFEGMNANVACGIMESIYTSLEPGGEFTFKINIEDPVEYPRIIGGLRSKAMLWHRKIKNPLPFDWNTMVSLSRESAIDLGQKYADAVQEMNYNQSQGNITFTRFDELENWISGTGFRLKSAGILIPDCDSLIYEPDIAENSSGVFLVTLQK